MIALVNVAAAVAAAVVGIVADVVAVAVAVAVAVVAVAASSSLVVVVVAVVLGCESHPSQGQMTCPRSRPRCCRGNSLSQMEEVKMKTQPK